MSLYLLNFQNIIEVALVFNIIQIELESSYLFKLKAFMIDFLCSLCHYTVNGEVYIKRLIIIQR